MSQERDVSGEQRAHALAEIQIRAAKIQAAFQEDLRQDLEAEAARHDRAVAMTLLPCLVCNGVDVVMHMKRVGAQYVYAAKCLDCGEMGPSFRTELFGGAGSGIAVQLAVQKWNNAVRSEVAG